jgi:hypothetical protein
MDTIFFIIALAGLILTPLGYWATRAAEHPALAIYGIVATLAGVALLAVNAIRTLLA